jgi:DNA (cytosine-5)-methyltransferase 1
MMRVLDLFSGIGGFSLGLERTGGFETVAFCEIEPFPRRVLAKHWPGVPIYEDVRKLRGSDIGAVDVICGGYPCQPFSTAGKRLGADDDRHLWPEFMRLVDELRPAWVIGENVAGHISMGLDDVLSDLEGSGYACRSFVVPACAVDAQHRRDRVWTVAHASQAGLHIGVVQPGICNEAECQKERPAAVMGGEARRGQVLADAECGGRPGPWEPFFASNPAQGGKGQATQPFDGRVYAKWRAEPDVGRVAYGVSGRVDRLKALGNAVVPQIPELIGRAILQQMEKAA